MALTRITTTTSRFIASAHAFADGTAAADTLIVDEGAYLTAKTFSYYGARLDGQGIWTVTVNGSIYAQTSFGIYVDSGNTAVSSITIGASGVVGVDGGRSIVAFSPVKITNSGQIFGAVAFNAGAMNTLINYGTMEKDGNNTEQLLLINNSVSGAVTLTNSATGVINGDIRLANGNDIVTNDGVIAGDLDLGEGNNQLKGTTGSSRSITAGAGNDVVSAKSVINVDLGAGNNTLMIANGGSVRFVTVGSGNDKITIGGEAGSTADEVTLNLGAGNNTLTFTATAKVYADIEGQTGNNIVSNAGRFDGSFSVGSGLTLTNSLTNSGFWEGNYFGNAGNDKIVNSGTFDGNFQMYGGTNSFLNTGTWIGHIEAVSALGTHSADNKGVLTGSYTGGELADSVTNSKSWTGNVDLGNGANKFTNSGLLNGTVKAGTGDIIFSNSITGKISGAVTFSGATGTIGTIDNSGMLGNITLGNGNDTVTNGGIITWLELRNGVNKLTNSGTIQTVAGGSGVDTVTNTGRIAAVNLLGGDDKYTGSSFKDNVRDGGGSDNVSLGAGDDFYDAIALLSSGDTDGSDRIDGGADTDHYSAAFASGGVSINIDTMKHSFTLFSTVEVFANTASGAGGADQVFLFENVTGTSFSDTIMGNSSANFLSAGGGTDFIFGYGGNDTLEGGSGADYMMGGIGNDKISGDEDTDLIFGEAGADRMEGGLGADSFYYLVVTDSGVTKATRDVITDFTINSDKIDLSDIDANIKNTAGSNDVFVWLGYDTPFTATPGGLRALQTAYGTLIEGDINGDLKADFSIELTDPAHNNLVSASDFDL